MTPAAFAAFSAFRADYRAYCAALAEALPGLGAAQQRLVDERAGGAFPVETPVVYNGALDDVGPDAEVRIVLVADNPGRREQAAANRRYLVGPSGKIADGWFRAHPELGVDFRRGVVILNKTPIHTPRTAELRELAASGGPEIAAAIAASQLKMVELIAACRRALAAGGAPVPALWIIGYSEMGPRGLFAPFSAALTAAYAADPAGRAGVRLFRHFSMNQFSVDVAKRRLDGEALDAALERIGTDYRRRVLGW
jgi:hypothetical protein